MNQMMRMTDSNFNVFFFLLFFLIYLYNYFFFYLYHNIWEFVGGCRSVNDLKVSTDIATIILKALLLCTFQFSTDLY